MITSFIEKLSKIWFIVFLILLICVILIIQLTAPTVKKELVIATGPIQSDSYAYAISYKSLLKEEGVKLSIIPTQGSLATLEIMKNKKADIGFVHSGVLQQNRKYKVSSLASVYKEPLWVFYRDDGYEVNYILETVGKKVGISGTNDATLHLVEKIFTTSHLIDKKNLIVTQDANAIKQLKNKKIDFFITLASKDNSSLDTLLKDDSVKLLHIKRSQAYIQKYNYLTDLTLFEGSIDLYRNIPSYDMHILSTTQNLVTNNDVPNELIRILLKKVTQIHGSLDMQYIDTLPNDEAQMYIKHGESWLETIFPYWIASNIDRLKLFIIPLIWLIIPLFKSLIPLYIFRTRSKVFRWYSKLNTIKTRLKNNDEDFLSIKNDLELLKNEIDTKTKVPLAYMGEYYNLIVHIELLEHSLEKLIKK